MKKEYLLTLFALILAVVGLFGILRGKPLPIPIKPTTITIEQNITAYPIKPKKNDTTQHNPLGLLTRFWAEKTPGQLYFQGKKIPYTTNKEKIFFSLLGNYDKPITITLKKRIQACFIPKAATFEDKNLYLITPKKILAIHPLLLTQKGYFIAPPCPKRVFLFKDQDALKAYLKHQYPPLRPSQDSG